MNKDRIANNTLMAQAAAFENANKIHPTPANCPLNNEAEEQYWAEIIKSKAFDLWTPAGLALAYKALRYEFLIRRGYEELNEMIAAGASPFNPESVASDYAKEIEKMERLQLTTLRAAGLTFTAIASGSTSARAVADQNAAELKLASIGRTDGLPGFMAAN